MASTRRQVDQTISEFSRKRSKRICLPSGGDIEALGLETRPQVRELAPMAGREIEEPEILVPDSALNHDERLSTGQKTIPVAPVPDPQIRKRRVARPALRP